MASAVEPHVNGALIFPAFQERVAARAKKLEEALRDCVECAATLQRRMSRSGKLVVTAGRSGATIAASGERVDPWDLRHPCRTT